MRIQHNIMAMSAYRNYTNNVSAMKKNLEKLSSGYKINRAGDDAAGLAISEKMRAQITGLETAQKNAKDGISLVQTAEGALTEVHDMLNRMVELATQSANGTYDNTTDRDQLQKEMNQLREEINRIADSSNFNGIKLLDGSMSLNGTSPISVTNGSAAGVDNSIQFANASGVFGAVPSKASGTPAATGSTTLHSGGKNGIQGQFTIALDQVSVAASAGATAAVVISIGSATATVSASVASKGMSGATIATRLVATAGKYVVVSASGAVSFASTATAAGTYGLVYTGSAGNDGTVTYKLTGYVTANGSYQTVATDAWNNSGTIDAGLAAHLKTAGETSLNFNVGIASNTGILSDNRTNYGSINVTQTQIKEAGDLGNAAIDFDLAAAGSDAKYLKIELGKGSQTTKILVKLDANAAASSLATSAGGSYTLVDVSGISDVTAKKNAIAAALNTNAGIRVGVNNDGKLTLSERMNATGSSAANADIQKAMGSEGTFSGLIKVQAGKMDGATNGTATSTINVDPDRIYEGNSITLNIDGQDTKFVFTKGNTVASDAVRVDLNTVASAGGVIGALKNAVAGVVGTKATVTVDGNAVKVTVTASTAGANTPTAIVASVAASAAQWVGNNGLMLQIGDTADDYNQLKVNIKDMHTKAMGDGTTSIADISIATQEDAADAVDVIKAAINYVSDVRGTLGATQNRLDHTINNLSVMTENIQDAESTIRDTDVAEEMMAYTKNNILIQSAQAMLAQANQVPQGVLQLLQ